MTVASGPIDAAVATRHALPPATDSMLERAEELIHLLQDLAKCDAVALTMADPFDDSLPHHLLAARGYPDATLPPLLASNVSDNPAWRLMRPNVREALRWSDVRRDWQIEFGATQIAQEYLLPNGFHEGATSFLRTPDGDCVGALHVNWVGSRAATDERRSVLESFGPVLARASNLLQSHRVVADHFFPDAHVAAFVHRATRPVPGREHGTLLAEGGALSQVLATSPSPKPAKYLWIDDRGSFHRVHVVQCADGTMVVAESEEPAPFGLTPREVDVVQLMAEGLSNIEIAKRLQLSPSTISTHVEHILEKMGCTTRAQVASLSSAEGLRLL